MFVVEHCAKQCCLEQFDILCGCNFKVKSYSYLKFIAAVSNSHLLHIQSYVWCILVLFLRNIFSSLSSSLRNCALLEACHSDGKARIWDLECPLNFFIVKLQLFVEEWIWGAPITPETQLPLSFMTLSAKGSWVSGVIGDRSNLFPNRKFHSN